MTLAYVGLGANLGEPRRQLQAALQEMNALPESRVTTISAFYRSSPIGNLDQPDFLNAVAELDTALSVDQLLAELQRIEQGQGRERPFPGAPRRLDLDLLLYGDTIAATPRLTLPHPRMHERAFVLEPLTEIAPGIAIPGHGAARGLLAACGGQQIKRLE